MIYTFMYGWLDSVCILISYSLFWYLIVYWYLSLLIS